MQAEWVTFGSHSEDAVFWLTKTLIFDSICYFPTCLEFPSECRIWLGSSNIFLQGRGRQLECNGKEQNSSLSLGGLLFLLVFWKYSVFHFEFWARTTGGDFVLQGTFDCLEMFLVVVVGCYWHLVSGGQGCCQVSYSTQDNPHNKELCGSKYQQCQSRETLARSVFPFPLGDRDSLGIWKMKVLSLKIDLFNRV